MKQTAEPEWRHTIRMLREEARNYEMRAIAMRARADVLERMANDRWGEPPKAEDL